MERDVIDCRGFDDRLSALLDGRLTHPERDAMEAHAAACPRCREILSLVTDDLAADPVPAPEGLTEAILRRTSGPPCAMARDLLCDLTDGTLPEPDAELVRTHLEMCHACDACARALGRLAEVLPALAEIAPDGRFVGDVLARTTRSGRLRLAGFMERLARQWRGILARPRFAAEGAYVASLVLISLLAFPGSPLQDLPRNILAAVRANPFEMMTLPDVAVSAVKAHASELQGRAQEAAGRRLSEAIDYAKQDVEKVAGAIRRLKDRATSSIENAIGLRDRSDNEPTIPSDQEGRRNP